MSKPDNTRIILKTVLTQETQRQLNAYTWRVHAQQRAMRQRIARTVLVVMLAILLAMLIGGVLAARHAQAQPIAYPPQAFLPFVAAWRPSVVSSCVYPSPCDGVGQVEVQP
jgi:hypothetical protein